MPDKQVWDTTEALTLADTWQSRFDGKNMPEGFFPQLHALAEYLHDNGQVQRAVDLLRSESSMGVSRFWGTGWSTRGYCPVRFLTRANPMKH